MENPGSSSPASALSPAEQARIRRERRQAKVREGGTSRLTKITGTQGSTYDREPRHPDIPTASPALASSPPASNTDSHTPDPPEYDISEHHYMPGSHHGNTSDELRQIMLMEAMRGQQGGGGSPFGSSSPFGAGSPFGTPGGTDTDPLSALLAQMGGQPSGGGMPDMDEMMRNMPGMAEMMGGAPQPVKTDPWALWWRALHALCSLLLTLYCISWGYDGTSLGRVDSANIAKADKPQMFYYFSAMELLLQSGRFLLEKGKPPQGSLLTTIGNFLPPPFGTALKTMSRYSVIWNTIMADAGVVVFVLGMAHWWYGGLRS